MYPKLNNWLFAAMAILQFTTTGLWLHETSQLKNELAYQKLEPRIEDIRLKRITYDTWIAEATFVGLTSETITPTIKAHTSFKSDPVAKEDSVYRATGGNEGRRFEWMLIPEECERGGDISSPCLKIQATTLDSEGHEHKISSPFIDFQVR